MSWTSVFPVLSDEMVGQYEAEATAAEKAELAEWFAVKTVINAKPETRHVASFSLFWKNPRQDDPDLPALDRKTLKHAKRRGLVRRFDPWSHYVQPLLDGARQILPNRSDVSFRIYLAADLELLVKDLVKAGCENCCDVRFGSHADDRARHPARRGDGGCRCGAISRRMERCRTARCLAGNSAGGSGCRCAD